MERKVASAHRDSLHFPLGLSSCSAKMGLVGSADHIPLVAHMQMGYADAVLGRLRNFAVRKGLVTAAAKVQ